MRLSRLDIVLLTALLPAGVACSVLHIRQVNLTGLARPPFNARAGVGADAYPVVGSFTIEQQGEVPELRVGDRLLQVGEEDLAGIGHLGFFARAIHEADRNGDFVVTFERNGQRGQVVVPLALAPRAWMRIPFLLSLTLVATAIFRRAVPTRPTRLLLAMSIGVLLWQTPFHGQEMVLSYISQGLFYAGGLVCPPLIILWAMHFPPESPRFRRSELALPWIFAAAYGFVRAHYFVEGPLPDGVIPDLVFAIDGLWVTAIVAALTRNYRAVGSIGRRRTKWVLYACYLGSLPAIAVFALPALGVGSVIVDELIPVAFVMAAFGPVGILIGTARFNLYDIDRLISATTSYSALAFSVLAVVFNFLPLVARSLGDLLGIEAAVGQMALSVLLALTVIPAHQRVRPQIERIFFPDRHAVESGIVGLLRELSSARSPEALSILAAERLDELFRTDSVILYLKSPLRDVYEPVFVRGGVTAPPFRAGSRLVSALARRMAPLKARAIIEGRPDVEIDSFERSALATLGVPLVLPIRHGDGLFGFLCLGGKRSGDVYTSTDVALLTAVSDKISSELQRFDYVEMLKAGEAMRASLRRYVPGQIAEQLEAGEDLEAGEREVTVLFVDIRSYTAYAERKNPREVFATVNRYTDTVSRVVQHHGGTVVEFNGDGMMAVFGAPRAHSEKERAAVLSAVELSREVDALSAAAGATLAVSVGVATGPAFVGNIEAADRMIWTVIGDTTNLAARLQALTRDLDVSIVTDARTWNVAEPPMDGWRAHPATTIRGRREPVDLYALEIRS